MKLMAKSSSSTNLTAPTPPPGFSVRNRFNPSVQLKPLEVYMCTVELMSILCHFPWTWLVPVPMEMSGEGISTEIVLHPFPPGSTSRLQVSYAILALYQAGLAIAKENRFYELETAFFMEGQEVGWFDLRRKRAEGPNGPSSLSLISASANRTAMVTPDSGTVLDPEDSKFVVTYSFDGVRIKAQDIFTTTLDGLAIAAPHNNDDVDAAIPAARSATGDTVLSTWTVADGGSPQMTWARLKKALIMMWDMLIIGEIGRKPRFEGLIFGMEYEGVEIGAGRMLRVDSNKGDEDSAASAVEK